MKGQLVVTDSARIAESGKMSNRARAQHATNRRILMLRADLRQVQIASALKVDKGLVSRVVAGTKRSARVERHISKILKTPRSALWP